MADAPSVRTYHSESQRLLEMFKDGGGSPLHELSVQAAREQVHSTPTTYRIFQGDYDFRGSRQEQYVPSEEVPAGIPVFVYRPDHVAADPPIYVFFHGGGLVLGTRLGVDGMCQRIASGAGCVVVSVDYRLAPENKFPACMDDCCCVVHWVAKNKTLVGGSEKSRVGIGGDSSGGCIAASVAHDCPQLDFTVLIYPHVVARGDYSLQSYEEYKDGPVLTRPFLEWMRKYASDEQDYDNPRLAPMLRPRFDNLPPTLLIVAQHDPFRDDSYVYREALSKAGVATELHLAEGATHGFYTMPAIFKELSAAAYDKTIAFIKQHGTADE